MNKKLLAVPALTDNYIWMLHDGRQAMVVDPGDAAPVHAALDEHGLGLAGILVTHHHADHVGGVDALRSRLQGPVYGPAHEAGIPMPFTPLNDGDRIDLLGLRWEVLEVPGHTLGHIAYRELTPQDRDAAAGGANARAGASAGSAPAAPLLFCGDTLFSAGCGRLFEGTPQQMSASLARLAALPDDTAVCCTHEYTLANLRFAREVEPANVELAAYTSRCEALRAEGRPTLPSSIGQERRVNPFLRCSEPDVVDTALRQGAAATDPVSVFTTLREWKNRYR